MRADIQGALDQINKSWKAFVYKGQPMQKHQVKAVLEYGLKQGYKHTGELSDSEVDKVLSNL